MKRKTRIGGIALTVLLGWLSGCIEYRIETTMNPDGGGLRSVTVEMTDAQNLTDKVTRQEFIDLMSLTRDRGWDYSARVRDDGDTVHVFRKDTEIPDLRSWRNLDDELHISASRPATADSIVGYLKAGSVHFRNKVSVRATGQPDGAAAFRYQESFVWENGLDALVESLVGGMEGSIQATFPDLADRDRGEILGVARVELWDAIEQGALDSSNDDEDRLWEEALDGIVSLGIRTLRTRYPSATEGELRSRLDIFSEDFEGEDPMERFETLLPGLSDGGGSVTFELTMPGTVTTTNAHERDGNRLKWEFGTDDAIAAPVVLVAESVVRG